jgi:hypothetical protein
MKPRERRETGEMDLFRSRLDQIINMDHELVRLAKAVSWEAIEARCGEVYSDGPGMPPLPTRLMAGLAILKHTFRPFRSVAVITTTLAHCDAVWGGRQPPHLPRSPRLMGPG